MWKDQDIGLGVVIILLSSLFLTQTAKLSSASAMFPKWLLWMMVFAAVLIIVKACVRLKRKGQPKQHISLREFGIEAGIPGGMLLLACLLLELLGFYICCFLILIAVSILQDWILEGRYSLTKAGLLRILCFSGGVSVLMFFCFSVLLSLPTPAGILGF
ncbi:MAG: hypothetical protein HFG20_02905 [Anaerotruncus sp.]|jgi:cobalamin synthase|nr:hypothetical protein [Anaerotruncus sp.]